MNLNKKKIIIPIIVLVIVVLMALSIGLRKNKSDKLDLSNQDAIASDNLDSDEVDSENVLDVESEKGYIDLSDVLTFEKDGGVLRLYSDEGELLDELDLKTFSFENEYLINYTKTLKIDNNSNENYVYIKLDNNEIAKAEVNKGKMFIYDKDGKVIKRLDIEDLDKESNIKDLEDNDLQSTTFTNFKTMTNELVFRDNSRNSLVMVEVKDDKIITTSVLNNIELESLSSVFLTNDFIYLTFIDDTSITKVPRNYKNDIESVISKINVGEVPNFVICKDDNIYFSTPDKIGKYDVENKNIDFIEVGDITLDIYNENNYIYVINQFGKGKENSVLMKINIEEFIVEEIMELKGINSRFIGIENQIAYIRQNNSIKEVDLKEMKPKRSFSRKEGIPVQVKNDAIYKLEDNNIVIISIKDNTEVLKTFKGDGFNLYLINGR